MPLDIHDSKLTLDAVTSEDLERDDERVLHEIRVDGSVEDVDGSIVGAGGEERVGAMVVDCSDGFGLVPEGVEGRREGGKGKE